LNGLEVKMKYEEVKECLRMYNSLSENDQDLFMRSVKVAEAEKIIEMNRELINYLRDKSEEDKERLLLEIRRAIDDEFTPGVDLIIK